MNFDLALTVSLLIVTLFYCLSVLALALGLRRTPAGRSSNRPFVSLIVAARNEEQTLGSLLSVLSRQSYPLYEVVVVNDRSTDRTAEVIQSFQTAHPFVRRIDVESVGSDLPPKKHALAQGIKASRGEILCFTDADCVPTESWISELVAAFDDSTGLVAGYSPYDASLLPPTRKRGTLAPLLQLLFHRFIEYEAFKGAIWAAGSIGLKRGWLCTGRSLAYRRRVYDEVGGFRKIARSISGDDDLFLQLVRRETSWRIRYVSSPASFVRTAPPVSFSAFLNQRSRHLSAARHFPRTLKFFLGTFHLSSFVLFAALICSSFWYSAFPVGVWAFAAKIGIDTFLFATGASVFRQWKFAPDFLLMEILTIFYNTFLGPIALLKKFEWKSDSTTK